VDRALRNSKSGRAPAALLGNTASCRQRMAWPRGANGRAQTSCRRRARSRCRGRDGELGRGGSRSSIISKEGQAGLGRTSLHFAHMYTFPGVAKSPLFWVPPASPLVIVDPPLENTRLSKYAGESELSLEIPEHLHVDLQVRAFCVFWGLWGLSSLVTELEFYFFPG
jgi:hypothetical protein